MNYVYANNAVWGSQTVGKCKLRDLDNFTFSSKYFNHVIQICYAIVVI